MKKVLKLSILFAIGMLLAISCQDDDVDTDVPSQRVIFTSEQSQGNQIRLNTDLTFGDVSTGVVSRLWTFPEGVANVQESSSDVVKAIFNRIGEHNVTLNQVFEEDAYVNGERRGRELDTTITVRVLEPIAINLKANYINPDGSLGDVLNVSDNAENEVIASRSVRYTFEAIGEPQNIDWTIDGGDPETASGTNEIDVTYKRLGTYNIEVSANTARPFGEALVALQNLIKVIPSTDPVTLDKVQGRRDGTLALEFSREMDETTINSDQFSIAIENNSVTVPASIQSIALDPIEKNILVVSLSGESVYIDDTVTISYVAGSLFTSDGVQADSFSDIPMDSFEQGVNILESSTVDFSFENSINADNWPDGGWGGIWAQYNFSISNNFGRTGTQSALIEMEAGGGMIVDNREPSDVQDYSFSYPVEATKSYEIGLWTYVDNSQIPDNSLGVFFLFPEIRTYHISPSAPNGDTSTAENPVFTPDFARDQWVFSSIIVTASETEMRRFFIRGYNGDNPNPFSFYIDDLSVTEVNLRP